MSRRAVRRALAVPLPSTTRSGLGVLPVPASVPRSFHAWPYLPPALPGLAHLRAPPAQSRVPSSGGPPVLCGAWSLLALPRPPHLRARRFALPAQSRGLGLGTPPVLHALAYWPAATVPPRARCPVRHRPSHVARRSSAVVPAGLAAAVHVRARLLRAIDPIARPSRAARRSSAVVPAGRAATVHLGARRFALAAQSRGLTSALRQSIAMRPALSDLAATRRRRGRRQSPPRPHWRRRCRCPSRPVASLVSLSPTVSTTPAPRHIPRLRYGTKAATATLDGE
jgi:hypothetical protein